MRNSSKLELAVDKNVFYTAAGIDDVPEEISAISTMALLKIHAECHTIVASTEYFRSIKNKLKRHGSVRSQYILHIINVMRATASKINFVEYIERLRGIPARDYDIAWFAVKSRNRMLLVANIDERYADAELAKVLEDNYGINVISCKEFIKLY